MWAAAVVAFSPRWLVGGSVIGDYCSVVCNFGGVLDLTSVQSGSGFDVVFDLGVARPLLLWCLQGLREAGLQASSLSTLVGALRGGQLLRRRLLLRACGSSVDGQLLLQCACEDGCACGRSVYMA